MWREDKEFRGPQLSQSQSEAASHDSEIGLTFAHVRRKPPLTQICQLFASPGSAAAAGAGSAISGMIGLRLGF